MFALCSVLAAGTLFAAPAFAGGRDFTGRAAPDVPLSQGINGVEGFPAGGSLAALRGKVVVLKFWFTACGPCRASMGEFQGLHDRFAPRGVVFVAVARDARQTAESFIRSKGYTFPVAFDSSGQASGAFGVTGFPTNYLIGADGSVRGSGHLDAATIERELLAAGSAPRAPEPSALAAAAPGSRSPAAPRAASRAATRSARPAARPAAIAARARPTAAKVVSKNVEELGALPAELAAVADAARANDYGAVLRLLDERTSPSSTGELGEARRRVRAIAMARFENRVERARARWQRLDYPGAYSEVRALARDFAGTDLEGWTTSWVHRYEASPVVRTLLGVPTAVAARR